MSRNYYRHLINGGIFSNNTPNTFIGNVSNQIPDKTTLANILIISENEIPYFSIIGNDIEARINVDYVLKNTTIFDNVSYFFDSENKVINTADFIFRFCYFIKNIKLDGATTVGSSFARDSAIDHIVLKNLTSVKDGGFFFRKEGTSSERTINVKRHIYIPLCENLGSTTGYADSMGDGYPADSIFENIVEGSVIYTNPILETINNGQPDGDLIRATELGAIVRYVTNFNKPSVINDLSVGQIKSTEIKLNFTIPTSSNAIDFYEVYVDGKINSRHKDALNVSAIGLKPNTTFLNISVVAVDVLYNKGDQSNLIPTTTTISTTLNTTGLISYYKLNESLGTEVKDSFNYYTGLFNSRKSEINKIGKIEKSYKFTGLSHIDGIDIRNLPITDKATFNAWVKLPTHTPSIENKTGFAYFNESDFSSHYPFTDGNIYLALFSSTRKTIGQGIVTDRTQWHMITVTANKITNEWKFYQNAQLVYTGTVGGFTLNENMQIGRSEKLFFGDFNICEISFYNEDIPLAQIQSLYNSGSGTTI